MNELQERLAKQVKISGWLVGLWVGMILGYIVTLVSAATSGSGLALAMIVIIAIAGVAYFILWIVGIVNSIKINALTNGENVVLVLFSILTFRFVNLIVTVMARNKFATYSGPTISEAGGKVYGAKTSNNSEEAKLKQAFVDGVITSKEYEAKLKKED